MASPVFPLWRLRLQTPEERQVDVDGVRWVRVQLSDGAGISIWPGHGPLLAETMEAPVQWRDSGGEHAVLAGAGILEISPGQVCIYTSPPNHRVQGAGAETAEQSG